MTLIIMPFNITKRKFDTHHNDSVTKRKFDMTISIMTLSILTLNIMTHSIMPFRIMILSIMTLSMIRFILIKENLTVSIMTQDHCAECHNQAECHYAWCNFLNKLILP